MHKSLYPSLEYNSIQLKNELYGLSGFNLLIMWVK